MFTSFRKPLNSITAHHLSQCPNTPKILEYEKTSKKQTKKQDFFCNIEGLT